VIIPKVAAKDAGQTPEGPTTHNARSSPSPKSLGCPYESMERQAKREELNQLLKVHTYTQATRVQRSGSPLAR